MTAAELLDLLKSHPKTCKALEVTVYATPRFNIASDGQCVWLSDEAGAGRPDFETPRFRRWLLGAAQEYADEHNIEVGWVSAFREWGWAKGEKYGNDFPTRLHALLAGIEEVADG